MTRTLDRSFAGRRVGLALVLVLVVSCASVPRAVSPRRPAALALRVADAALAVIRSQAQAAELAGTCEEVCAIADRICEAAARICELAREYPEERDLLERCGHARAHCEVARDRCRTCQRR